MNVTRKEYTSNEAIQKYHMHCNVNARYEKEIKEVKQGDIIRLFTYDNQLVYAFIPEIIQTKGPISGTIQCRYAIT